MWQKKPHETAEYSTSPASGVSPMHAYINEQTETRPGQTGLHLIEDNLKAFAARAASARQAQTSLDLQYYYWRGDLTGQLLLREAIQAADRGAHVRLLLDDFNTGGSDKVAKLLSSHPRIEVQFFNPSRTRMPGLRRNMELLFNVWSATRRMHNKAWIADNALAIVGGRNIGDAYFDASPDTYFVDLDVLAVGPAVAQASAIFERYWVSKACKTRRVIGARSRLAWLRGQLDDLYASERAKPYVAAIDAAIANRSYLDDCSVYWTENAEVIADPPEKALGEHPEAWIASILFDTLGSATSRVNLTSPYFIPGADGVESMRGMRARGVDLTVLTNSLASTDVAAVHGAYAKYRRDMLGAGIRLFELRTAGDDPERLSVFGSSAGALHTKAFTIDGKRGFVGSYNFDPRSRSINTEMGILFENPALAERLDTIFAGVIKPWASYRVANENDRLVWYIGDTRLSGDEPGASWQRRAIARLTGWLPFEAQL